MSSEIDTCCDISSQDNWESLANVSASIVMCPAAWITYDLLFVDHWLWATSAFSSEQYTCYGVKFAYLYAG